MPRINTYSDNASIENDDKMLTYDTQAAATKLTAFSIVWNWIVSKLHALTSSGAALTPSTDRVLMDKNGTMTRVEPAAVARYGIETYNGSTIAGSAQTVKSALDTLNSNGLYDRGPIRENVDLNDLKTPGLYYCNAASGSNFPSSGLTFNGVLIEVSLFANSGGVCQVCIDAVGTSKSIWRRYFTDNAWSDWVKQPERQEITDLNSKSVGANAGGHNSIFRGKNLGTAVTAAQWAAISAGTFDDLFVGDYWVINGVNWRIAAFDYWYNTGDANCTTHHAVIVPDGNLLNGDGSTTHWMNTSNATEGGYMGSGFYTGENADGTANTGKSQCLSKAESAFGSSHILQHREYLSNAVSNGYVSGGTWADSKIELMNESMVYGNRFFENAINGTNIPAAYTIDKGQLPLFALAPQYICNRAAWWLRPVVSSTSFAGVGPGGICGYDGASYAWRGLRPAFGIK